MNTWKMTQMKIFLPFSLRRERNQSMNLKKCMAAAFQSIVLIQKWRHPFWMFHENHNYFPICELQISNIIIESKPLWRKKNAKIFPIETENDWEFVELSMVLTDCMSYCCPNCCCCLNQSNKLFHLFSIQIWQLPHIFFALQAHARCFYR